MRVFFHPDQRLHRPSGEWHRGRWIAPVETPARAEALLAGLERSGLAWTRPPRCQEQRLARVHDERYLAFLRAAHADWLASGRTGEALPAVWTGERAGAAAGILARLGRYAFTLDSPVGPGTWEAVRGAVDCAVAAAQAVLAGERAALALCRPPGHHAGVASYGGYSYLNAAAIAAQALRDGGHERVAVVDVDYHHGNGTQEIFYARSDVFFLSVHADPDQAFPFAWGTAGERGRGAGRGANLNVPLPLGSSGQAFLEALAGALDELGHWRPDALVVSAGFDAFVDDPICAFALETADFRRIASKLAALGRPTVLVTEGGYALDALGPNLRAFLEGWRSVSPA